MILSIETYGSSALRRKAKRVEAIDAEIEALIADMLDTVRTAQGLGLAAEQVGRDVAVCIIDVPPSLQCGEAMPLAMPLVMINPEIIFAEGEQAGQEGCLSFPDLFVSVRRATTVTVTYLDARSVGCTLTARGLVARAIQHEVDHLNGVLLVDKMTAIQKLGANAKLKRIKRMGARVPAPA